MSTATTTTATAAPAAATAPAISAKLSTSIYGLLDTQLKAGKKFDTMVAQVSADRAEFNYNRDQCRSILQAGFQAGYAKLAAEQKLTGADAEAFVKAGMSKSGPDMSKALTLAFPKDENAATELKAADAAGLGLNAKLEIARGNTTVAAIQQERANKAAGAAPETARPGNATHPSSAATPTPAKPAVQPPFPETAEVSKLTPKERFDMSIRASVKYGMSLGLTFDECSDISTDTLSDMQAEAAEAANKGK